MEHNQVKKNSWVTVEFLLAIPVIQNSEFFPTLRCCENRECVCKCVCDRSKDMINRPVGSPRGRIVKIIDEVGVNNTPLPIHMHTHQPLLFTPPMNMPPSPNWIWKPAPLGCSSPSNELLFFPFRCFPFLPPPQKPPQTEASANKLLVADVRGWPGHYKRWQQRLVYIPPPSLT